LVGAFFVMYVSGFSINVLTMLAVVLSVGLVVDDAIVMAENIYVRIEQGMEPKEAGIDGAKEIFFAVVSTTVTLVSVFLPIVFMEGMTGRLFKEFSIVIAGSVTISSFVALTFTPMLATKLLRKRENKGWLYTKTEPFFEGMNNIYAKSLNAFLNHKWWSIPIVVILFRLHRLFLANHPLRTFSIGRPFIHFDQYTCTGRSYLRVHPRLYGPSGRHGRHVGSRAASPNGSCE